MAGALVAVAREEHRNLQQWSDEELEASEAPLAFEGQGRWRWTWEQRHNFLVEKKECESSNIQLKVSSLKQEYDRLNTGDSSCNIASYLFRDTHFRHTE